MKSEEDNIKEKRKKYEELHDKILILFAKEGADPNIAVHSLMSVLIMTINRMNAGGFGIQPLSKEKRKENIERITNTIKEACEV